MTNLTELWKKGELPSRDDDHLWFAYYIKHNDGYIHADSLWRGQWGIADRNSIEEVLAPVPSYELWKAVHEQWKVLLEENEQLKDLLKECLPYISRSLTSRMIKNSAGYKKDMKLLTKINQVLGEE